MKTYTVRGQRVTVWDASEQAVVPPSAKTINVVDETKDFSVIGYVQRVEVPCSDGILDGRRTADAAIRHFPAYRWRFWSSEAETLAVMAPREFGRAPAPDDDVTTGDAEIPPAVAMRGYIAARWRVVPNRALEGAAYIQSENGWGLVFGAANLPVDLAERVVLEHNALIGVGNDELSRPDEFAVRLKWGR